uniref:Photosystem I reaction center subunit IX n=1 Tax=Marsupiomonas sp. NIES 1824 TaxID=1562198 RepID=A0A097KLU7_9CHLO|nr:subunit IX of photosystem I [Marsupiomonas sp. NIES 1824]
MKNFATYLSTAPVLTLVTVSFISGLLIEINRYFPDSLTLSF